MALSVSNSSIKVFNAALVHIGVPEVSSFLDNSLAARTGNAMFEDILESALCEYPWRFAQRRVQLQRVSETVPAGWEGLYAIPTEIRKVNKVLTGTSERPADFDVFERRVAVNVPESSSDVVTAEGTVMVTPDRWPGHFRQPFILYLAAHICVPITQDERMADRLENLAARKMAKAASRDAQGRTQKRLDTKLFIRARRRGRSR